MQTSGVGSALSAALAQTEASKGQRASVPVLNNVASPTSNVNLSRLPTMPTDLEGMGYNRESHASKRRTTITIGSGLLASMIAVDPELSLGCLMVV